MKNFNILVVLDNTSYLGCEKYFNGLNYEKITQYVLYCNTCILLICTDNLRRNYMHCLLGVATETSCLF